MAAALPNRKLKLINDRATQRPSLNFQQKYPTKAVMTKNRITPRADPIARAKADAKISRLIQSSCYNFEMWLGTKISRESTGLSSPSTSVGEILLRTADAFPAASPFPIGESLMQVTLSPQEAADLLFYLMSAMSTVSARPTTPSIKTISSF